MILEENDINYVIFGSEQYKVTDESYINFTVNEKCR